MRYQIDIGNQLVVSWYEKRVEPAEFANFTAEIAANPDFRPEFRLLAILAQDIDLSELSVDVMRQMQADEVANLNNPQGLLSVVLVEDGMAEVIGNLYSVIAADDPGLRADIRIVSSVAEASAVLGVSLAHLHLLDFAL